MKVSTQQERFTVSTIARHLCEKLRKSKLASEEDALVVGWFDIGKLLIFTSLLFVLLGPVMDAGWSYIHTASTTTDLYTTSDVSTVDNVYNFYKWIPLVSLGIGLFYIVNYSNMKKNS